MSKAIWAVAAAALVAAAITLFPSLSPRVEASTPVPVTKGDRLDIRAIGPSCSEQAWPYYETGCLRRRIGGARRAVRVVTSDRAGFPAP